VEISKESLAAIRAPILLAEPHNQFAIKANRSEVEGFPNVIDELWLELTDIKYDPIRDLVIRLLITILSLHLVITVPKAPSLSTITAPFSGTDESGSNIPIQDALNRLGFQKALFNRELDKQCQSHELHPTTKAGPNGHGL